MLIIVVTPSSTYCAHRQWRWVDSNLRPKYLSPICLIMMTQDAGGRTPSMSSDITKSLEKLRFINKYNSIKYIIILVIIGWKIWQWHLEVSFSITSFVRRRSNVSFLLLQPLLLRSGQSIDVSINDSSHYTYFAYDFVRYYPCPNF